MGAAKANNSKDTYLATAVTFIVIGALFLIDKLIHFSSIGLPWVMNKDNMLLYASICFLIFKLILQLEIMIKPCLYTLKHVKKRRKMVIQKLKNKQVTH
jgi:hypothetical protein